MVKVQSRRAFIRTAPLAAAAVALPLTDKALFAEPTAPEDFKLIPTDKFAEALTVMKAKPGNFNFFDAPTLPFTCVMTFEEKKSAKEFEWHEGRDHILQILDGTTVYEVGGTPQNGRNTKPGEWLAPSSQGATTLTLHKGDTLIIPRNTPHKRSTDKNVTFYLISTTGEVKA